MSDAELEEHGMGALVKYAEHLNAIDSADPLAQPRYDVLAGAIIWPDETNASTPFEIVSALRQLRRYRTHVMLQGTIPDHSSWKRCVELFPNWVGFLPERRQATPELRAAYQRGDAGTRWGLRQLDRESKTEN